MAAAAQVSVPERPGAVADRLGQRFECGALGAGKAVGDPLRQQPITVEIKASLDVCRCGLVGTGVNDQPAGP